ncbi:MAG: M14 family zinc carboxypeptidase [Bacteroidota bacterium]
MRLTIGVSEQGRPVEAAILGRGTRKVALLAGAHADEPVGPATLRALTDELGAGGLQAVLEAATLYIVPHANPDGEARNRLWIDAWPDLSAFVSHVDREPPGRDVEFGYPDLRPENEAIAQFFAEHGPFDAYVNLHGMAFSDGILLLIERHWAERVAGLQAWFRSVAEDAGLRLHDHDRGGDKGFQYYGPGFTSTPEGQAMQAHFRQLGDEATARKFRLSSMEYIRSLGGDPLCLVTELPLFLLESNDPPRKPGVPAPYLDFKDALAEAKLRGHPGASAGALAARYQIRPLDFEWAMRMQRELVLRVAHGQV